MPLIKCVNCGQEYSSYRSCCPNCNSDNTSKSLNKLGTSELKRDVVDERKAYNLNVLSKYQLAINEEKCHIQIGEKIIPFDDIIDYNFIDMSFVASSGGGSISTQTKTNTGSLLGRSLVGGIIAGPAGAIIGGATSSRVSESKISTSGTFTVQRYELQIVVNDFSDPVIRFAFDNASEPNVIISYLKVIFFRRKN